MGGRGRSTACVWTYHLSSKFNFKWTLTMYRSTTYAPISCSYFFYFVFNRKIRSKWTNAINQTNDRKMKIIFEPNKKTLSMCRWMCHFAAKLNETFADTNRMPKSTTTHLAALLSFTGIGSLIRTRLSHPLVLNAFTPIKYANTIKILVRYQILMWENFMRFSGVHRVRLFCRRSQFVSSEQQMNNHLD